MMVFKDDRDKDVYKAIIAATKKLLPFLLYHYVLMDNHVHLEIALQPTAPIAQIMKKISQTYAIYHAARYTFIGHLWQDRYKSIPLTEDRSLLACGMYIELNPVRAKMVQTPGEYRWSSYRHYAFGQKDLLVDDDPLYRGFGSTDEERQATYRRLCEQD